MHSLKQKIEMCTKLRVDPAKIDIGNDESKKIDKRITDMAIKQMLNKKEPD